MSVSDESKFSPYSSPELGVSSSAHAPSSNASSEGASMRADLDALKEQVSTFIAKAGTDAAKAAKDTTDQVGAKASELASAATDQMKTFASELERIGRGNPLGAIAGALLVGVVIGLLGRRS